MRLLVVVLTVLTVVHGNPGLISPIIGLNSLDLPPTKYIHPEIVTRPIAIQTQYHAQDELGQAAYGHSEPLQAHNAIQDAHGNKLGSYSYIAPDGKLIFVNYVADALGFRVESNALPEAPKPVEETPDVVEAKNAYLESAKSRSKRDIGPVTFPASTEPLAPIHFVAPGPVPIIAPLHYAAPIPIVKHQPIRISKILLS